MPYGVRGRPDLSGWFVVRLVTQQEPPLELSVIFADMISNVRATPSSSRGPHPAPASADIPRSTPRAPERASPDRSR